jgi:hypothetical protein
MLRRLLAKLLPGRRFRLAVVLCLIPGANVFAESPEFPYDAIVRADQVEVRSGPGQRYYVTGRLAQQQKVTVRRHDPGGWYMIDPPPGSFSWMDADLVRDNGDGTGMVRLPRQPDGRAPRALARIGSQFSDDHAFFGRELADGDTVQILGERTLNTEHGALHMLQIAPPPLEYRWVKGDYIVPADPGVRATVDADPYSVPSTALVADSGVAASEEELATSGIQQVGLLEEQPDPFAVAEPVESTTAAPAEPIATLARPRRATDRAELAALDTEFLRLGSLPVDEWNLDQLIAGYFTLQQQSSADVAALAGQRISALSAKRKIWDEYQAFMTLTGETSARDAQLAALQQSANGTAFDPILISGANQNDPALALLTPEEHYAHLLAAQSGQPTAASTGEPQTVDAPASAIPTTGAGQLAGAGIVQSLPTPNGAQAFYLTSPDGRVLALLQPTSELDLQSLIGHSIGVTGQRGYDAGAQSDIIAVETIVPVQLAN